MKQLTLDPYIPLGLWAPLVVAAVGLLVWYAASSRSRLPRRRWIGVIALMTTAIAVPLSVLLNPTWLERIPPPAGKPLLTVLVDRSASMATRDAQDGRTRYEVARETARRMAEELSNRYDVRLRGFADGSALTTADELDGLAADGPASDLAQALEAAIDEDRPQGQAVLLLSDGIHNAGAAEAVTRSAAKAKAMAVMVMTHTLGGSVGVKDIDVRLDMSEELAFVGQRISATVRLRQRGSLTRKVRLSLTRDGRPVEQRDVELLPDSTASATFEVMREEPGLYRYEIEAQPHASEVTDVNNRVTLLLRVVDEPVRVLLLEGKPYWDTKFFIRTLAADPLIELVSVVQLTENRLLQRKISSVSSQDDSLEAASPAAEEGPLVRTDEWTIRDDARAVLGEVDALDDYQIVVLGRDAEVYLNDDSLTRLEEWLADGKGSLVCFRGSPSSRIGDRLGALMPVRWQASRESRFRMRWTEEGRALRWLPADDGGGEGSLGDLPSVATSARPHKPSPLAIVLARGASDNSNVVVPTLSYKPVGLGRVVVVEGAGMWRWAFLAPAYRDHDEVYGTLWRSLMRWLVVNVGLLSNQEVALTASKVTFTTTENVSAELLVRQDGSASDAPKVLLSGESLQEERVVAAVPSGDSPGQYRVSFGRLPEGRYRARVQGVDESRVAAITAFDVRGNLMERLEIQANPALMKHIAQTSGGVVLENVDTASVAGRFEQRLDQSRPERIKRTTAWDRWWLLIATLALWATAWGLRRWSGLV